MIQFVKLLIVISDIIKINRLMSKTLFIAASILILAFLFPIKESALSDSGCDQHLRGDFSPEESHPVLSFAEWKIQFGKIYRTHQVWHREYAGRSLPGTDLS